MLKNKTKNKTVLYTLVLLLLSVIFSIFASILKIYVLNWKMSDFLLTFLLMLPRVILWIIVGMILYLISYRNFILENKRLLLFSIHLVLSFIFAFIHCVLNYYATNFVLSVFSPGHSWTFDTIIQTYFRYNIIIYWLFLVFFIAARYYTENKKRKEEMLNIQLKTAQLESKLTEAHLQSLKMQIRPHFLFNTLNTINGLMDKNIEEAKRTLNLLSELLRTSLQMTNVQEIQLKEEVEFIKKYVEIQKIRFKDKLGVKYEISEDTLDAAVPILLLQPITENAVTHGIEKIDGQGFIKIVSKTSNNRLVLEVHDNGDFKKNLDEIKNSGGLGLKNTIERLNELYSDKYSIDFKNSEYGGLSVFINIPFKKMLNDKND